MELTRDKTDNIPSHEYDYNILTKLVEKKQKQQFVEYVKMWAVKTPAGIMVKGKTWEPVSMTEFKKLCAGYISGIKAWEEYYETCSVECVLEPNGEGDTHNEGKVRINLWNPYLVKELPEYNQDEVSRHVAPFLHFIKTCWCNNEEELFSQIVNHFTNIFKYPSKRDGVSVVLKGTTKRNIDVVFAALKKILALNHFADVAGKGVITNSATQNDTWSQSLILVLNEPISRYDLIINIIENDTIFVKYKSHKPLLVQNIINLFIHTNEPTLSKFCTGKFSHLILTLNEHTSLVTPQILEAVEKTDPQMLLTWFLHQSIHQ